MRTFHFLVVCGILFAFGIVAVGTAEAHSIAPMKTITVRAGPYPLSVNYYSEPRGGQALIFSIVPETAPAGPMRYRVTAIPGTLVNAVPVKAILEADPGHQEAVQGIVNLPVSGQWLLAIDVAGPLGVADTNAPILAAAAPAIPEWLGWLIGMLPVWAMIGFIYWQAQQRRQLSLEWQ